MVLEKNSISRILVISLSNIGDVIMTFPVLDILKRDFPKAKLAVVVGPKAAPLLKGNDNISDVHIYRKKQNFFQVLKWLFELRKKNYDLIIDLKNTAIPFLVSRWYVTSPFLFRLKKQHMRQQHLHRLHSIHPFSTSLAPKIALSVDTQDRLAIRNLLYEELGETKTFIIISPGAADSAKRWPETGFAKLADFLISKSGLKLVFVGDDGDYEIAESIRDRMKNQAINLCGKTSLTQLAEVMRKSCLVISNDSASMHMASYLNIPTLAIFGPTDPVKYGPWSELSCFIEKKGKCLACQKDDIVTTHSCLQAIKIEEVLQLLDVSQNCVIFK